MQANTVCLSIEKYDELKSKETELEYFKNEVCRRNIAYETLRKSSNAEVAKFVGYILKKNVSEYRLDKFNLEQLLDDKNWEFLFYDCKDELLGLGITLEQMKEFIKAEKEAFDNKKADGE